MVAEEPSGGHHTKIIPVGTNHQAQIYSRSGQEEAERQAAEFDAYLGSLLDKHVIQLLAEELCEDSIRAWLGQGSVAARLAARRGLRHLFLSPTEEERQAAGIPPANPKLAPTFKAIKTAVERDRYLAELDASSFGKRDTFWAERLLKAPAHNSVCIVGSAHIASFSALLLSQGYQVQVVCAAWTAPSHAE